jgi:FMN phosphatase YigB (HAD superfamily)
MSRSKWASREQLAQALSGASRAVFDLDGTLYDTRDFERPALAAVVRFLQQRSGQELSGFREALWARRELDRHRPGLFDELLMRYELPKGWGADCAREFHGYAAPELTSAQCLRPLLVDLRDRGCRLALVSNGRPELQQRKLDLLGLTPLFDRCIFCDPRRPQELKPSPWAWRQLDEWRGDTVTAYIGDDPVDAEFAHAVGAPFVPFCFRSTSYDH